MLKYDFCIRGQVARPSPSDDVNWCGDEYWYWMHYFLAANVMSIMLEMVNYNPANVVLVSCSGIPLRANLLTKCNHYLLW